MWNNCFSENGNYLSFEIFIFVIPVQTGIQSFKHILDPWIPAFAGMTILYETIISDIGY